MQTNPRQKRPDAMLLGESIDAALLAHRKLRAAQLYCDGTGQHQLAAEMDAQLDRLHRAIIRLKGLALDIEHPERTVADLAPVAVPYEVNAEVPDGRPRLAVVRHGASPSAVHLDAHCGHVCRGICADCSMGVLMPGGMP